MKKYLMLATVGFAILISSCTNNPTSENSDQENSESKGKEIAMAALNSTDKNEAIGTAKFYSLADGKIKMDLALNFVTRADSTVAVHFHEQGDCGDMGMNTHGHWNPTNEPHGKWGSTNFHSGDIGNIKLDNKGKATLSITTDRWSITDGDIKNIIGRGIIIHGGTDDYTTQPTGNSGSRIGCGVIEVVK